MIEEQEKVYDLEHVRTYIRHATWLNYAKLSTYLGGNKDAISFFMRAKNPLGLGRIEEAFFNWLETETTYDPNKQYEQFL